MMQVAPCKPFAGFIFKFLFLITLAVAFVIKAGFRAISWVSTGQNIAEACAHKVQ